MSSFKPSVIAVSINTAQGTVIQARNIIAILKEIAQKTNAPIYSFGEDFVGGAGVMVMAASDKSYSSKHGMVGQFGFSDYHYDLSRLCQEFGISIRDFPSASKMPQFDDITAALSEYDRQWIKKVVDAQEAELRSEIISLRQKQIEAKGVTSDQLNTQLFSYPSIFATEAMKLGIIDGVGTYDAIMNEQFPDARVKEIANKQVRNKDVGETMTQLFSYYSPLAEVAAKIGQSQQQ